jgi:hypothetical protein
VELVTESQSSGPAVRKNGPSQLNENTGKMPLPIAEVRVSDSDEVKVKERNQKMQDFVQRRASRFKWSPERICQRYGTFPWRIGEVNWHVDEVNRQLVKDALSLVTAGDLRTKLRWPAEWYHNLIALQGDTWILDLNYFERESLVSSIIYQRLRKTNLMIETMATAFCAMPVFSLHLLGQGSKREMIQTLIYI